MHNSTAAFTAALLVAATSFAAAVILTAAPAFAQGATGVTVTVHGPSPFAPDAANPNSILPDLTGPGVSGVTVTVTEVKLGFGSGSPPTGTTGNDGTVSLSLPPGVYEVQVEGDGHTGVAYITVDANGGTETANFSLDGLPSTASANGGTDAIDGLNDTATGAIESGDEDALADALGELNAVANQSQSAAETLDGIADGIMDGLPDHIRNELEEDFAAATDWQGVNEAINEALGKIDEDVADAEKVAEALGQKYEETQAILDARNALRRLRMILIELKAHQNELKGARAALDEIASAAAAGNNSQSSANLQHRQYVQANIQRNLTMVGRPVVRAPRMPQVHHPRPRVEPLPHRAIRLEIPSGRR